jgi:signal transduction histidine kinase
MMIKVPSLRKSRKAAQNLAVLRWLVPIFLSVTAIAAELVEHKVEGDLHFDLLFFIELITFGLFGPIIVGIIISYLYRLVLEELNLQDELQALNRDLEKRVDQRTTELENRNRDLAHANAELQQLDQLKSDFVSLVSHELIAPLTTLNGGLELAMQQAGGLPPETLHTLKTLAKESERLTQFVQTILDVSRLEAGKLRLRPGLVAVTPLLKNAAEMILSNPDRPIQWNLCPDLPPLWADETYLEEVVRNLLRNADKYSPARQPIDISACREANNLCIRVTDRGPGIPIEWQSHIFDRFYRGPDTQDSPGWGLGLYFAFRITEALGGTLLVQSPRWPDPQFPGAEFCITLPVPIDPIEEENV